MRFPFILRDTSEPGGSGAAPTPETVVPPVPTAEPSPEPTPEPEPATVPISAVQAERKRRQTAEQEAAYYKGLAEGRTLAGAPTSPAAPDGDAPPVKPERGAPLNPEDFVEWDHYVRAQTAQNDAYDTAFAQYVAENARHAAKMEISQREVSVRQNLSKEQVHNTFWQRVNAAAVADPELVEIINNFSSPGPYQMPLSPATQEAVMKAEKGPEIMRHLFNNKQLAYELARMSPIDAAIKVGELNHEIRSKPAVTIRQVSTSPSPASHVDPGTGPITTVDDVFDESTKPDINEWMKAKNRKQYG